ncbi:MAG TPA: hypothetical protein VGM44_19740, partial [Polyangiaceae bacterium]
MSDPNEPKRPAPGRAGSPGAIGKELGDDLEFEPDALLDSLLFDEPPVSGAPTPKNIKLHEPTQRDYPDDEVTVVGRTEDLFLRVQADDGTSGLEDLASADIDELLSSTPSSAPAEATREATPKFAPPEPKPALPEIVFAAAPELPAVPRVQSTVPRPGIRPASAVPRPGAESTAKPPAVNPAGPPPRQPFPPARSPEAPKVAALASEPGTRFAPPRPGSSGILPPAAPPAAAQGTPEEEDERTHIYSLPASPDIETEVASESLLPDPFAPPPSSKDPRSSMPTLHHIEPQSRVPTLSAPQPAQPVSMPSIPAVDSLPATSLRDDELESFSLSEAPDPFGPEEADELTENAEVHVSSTGSSTIPPDALGASSIPPRASIPPSIWPDERPAQDHLGAQREAWVERAEWLESEAQGTSDPQAKARALIVASELWALVGDLSHARVVAGAAAAVPRAQAMAARQVRALAAADGDFKAVAPALELEIRGAATVDARVHAAYLSAEVHRLALNDDATAKKKLDLAVRAQQEDPRAHVAKLADLLGKSNAPARVRFPESPLFAELVRAHDELLRLRGAPQPAGTPPAQGPRVAFEEARRALSSGDREKTTEALEKLSSVEGLASACTWLSAALLGADGKTRGRAISRLTELAAQSGSRLARRALATRALEQGDADAVKSAVSGAQGEETFSATDRVALAALTGLPAQSLESTVWELARANDLRPLAAAWVAATGASLDVLSGSEASRAELKLGHSL